MIELELKDARYEAREDVDRERDRRIGLGFTWEGIPVDTRDTRDLDNISGLAQMAQQLAAMGDTTSTLPFRDAANVTHHLSVEQVIGLGMATFQHKASHYQAAWGLKDAIDAAEDVAGVEAVDIYDDAAWP